MSRILSILAAIALAWAAWWPLAAWMEARATTGWLEERRAAGWQAEWADVAVTGFPLTYVRRIAAPALADPGTGWAWRADALTLARPRHPQLSEPGLTVSWPPEQELQTPWQRLEISSGVFQADLRLSGEADRLDSGTLDVTALEVVSDAGWRMTLASGRLAALAAEAAPEIVTLTLSAVDLAPPARMARALSDADLAPDAIERLQAEAEVTFDRPWDRAALEQARPQPRRVVVKDAALRWGALELRVAGTLDVGEDGTPEGELLVKATNWRELLAAARASGALPEGLAGAAEGALELASRLAGSPRTLDLPLGFSNGRTRLGPVPLGPAPVLRLP